MKEGGVINSDFCRHPIAALEENTKKMKLRMHQECLIISEEALEPVIIHGHAIQYKKSLEK